MPIKAEEQKKRQKILMFVALGVFLVAALVLYFGFWKSTSAPVEILTPGAGTLPTQKTSGISEQKLNEINLDFDFLNNKILSFLKKHGNVPVQVDKEKVGRDNPFVPYQ